MKTLILFYSFTGKTGIIAKALGESLKADVVEIKDREGRKGFSGMLSLMKDTKSEVPAGVEPETVDVSGYDRIFLGSPNWGSACSAPMSSFIANNDFSGKSLVLFITQSIVGAKKAAKDITDRVEKKGGTVKSFFHVNTLLRSRKRVRRVALEKAEGYKSKEKIK